MFGGIVGEYEDVVQIRRAENVKVLVEDVVHEGLECGGSVGESEGHHEAFVQSPSSTERCGLYGVRIHADEVEGSA